MKANLKFDWGGDLPWTVGRITYFSQDFFSLNTVICVMRQADIFIFFYLFLLQDSYTLKLSYSPFNIDLFSQSTKLGDFTVLSTTTKKRV